MTKALINGGMTKALINGGMTKAQIMKVPSIATKMV
jgi:hypothetical protein